MSDNLSVHDAVAAAMANRTQAQPEQPAQDQPQPQEQEQQAVPDSELPEAEAEEQPLDADSAEAEDSEPLEGEETPEHDEQDSEDDEEPTFTVVVNGKEEEVNLGELQNGYMRQADYTRSKQALAEQGKALQTQAEQVNTRLGNMDAQLQAIDQMFFGTPPEQPPVDLMRTDPVAYEEQNRFFQQWHQSKHILDQKRQEIVQQRTQEAQAKHQEVTQAEAKEFLKAFPDVKDEAAFTAKVGELQHFATGYGYTLQELSTMTDHRAYVVLAELKALKEATEGSKDKARMKLKKSKVKSISSGRGQQKGKPKSAREQANQRFDQAVGRGGTGYSRNDAITAAVAAFTAKD